MTRVLAALSALSAVSLAACVGPEIQTPLHFVPERAPTDATLVVRHVELPSRLGLGTPTLAYAQLSPTMVGTQLLSEVEQGLTEAVTDAHVASSVVDERDVSAMGAGSHAFLVRFAIRDYASALDVPAGEIVAWTALGALTAGLGAIPLAGTRVSTEHRLVVEVELFDVRSALVVSVPTPGGELVERYDTAALHPVMRKLVRVRMRSGVGLGGVGGSAALDFVDAQAHELVRRVLAESQDELAAAIRRAETSPPPVVASEPAPTVDGDEPEVLYTPAFGLGGPGC